MKKLLILTFVTPALFLLAIIHDSNGRVIANQDPNKNKQAEKQFVNPKDLNAPGSYTHVVTAKPAKMIFVSGQVSLNKQGEVVGKGTSAHRRRKFTRI